MGICEPMLIWIKQFLKSEFDEEQDICVVGKYPPVPLNAY